MKPNRLHILCAAALVMPVASVPAAAQSNAVAATVKHWPMRPYLNHDGTYKRLNGEIESQNWAGYAVTAATYTSASATWQVPNVTNDGVPNSTEYVINWVGIGGDGDNTLIQLGTEEAASGTGATFFFTWWELYPADIVYTPMVVNPGDIITASLRCTAACSPGRVQTWQLTLTDETANSAWTQSFQYQSSMASAEWITEAPDSGSNVVPLADYRQVTYEVAANGANPNLSLAANGIFEVDPYGETSNPSAPANGDMFSTCWGAKGASLAPCVAGSVTPSSPAPPAAPPPPPPPPVDNVSASLTATPTTTTNPGQASKLTWTSANATTCAGNGFTVGNSGKFVTGPFAWALVFPRVTTAYSLTCTGAEGTATSMVTVTVK